MLSKQISGQTLPLLPLPHSHPHIFVRHPHCLFPCPLGRAGLVRWLSAQRTRPCRCELPLAGERALFGEQLGSLGRRFPPSSGAEVGNCFRKENDDTLLFGEAGAGTEVRIESVLNSFLALSRGNGVRNKSPLTPWGCGRGAMHMHCLLWDGASQGRAVKPVW